MSKEVKFVKVYVEDWETLNQYLSLLQYTRGRKMSFAEVLHELLEAVDKGKLETLKSEIVRA